MGRKTVIRRKDIIISSCIGVLLVAVTTLVCVLGIAPTTTRARMEEHKVQDAVKEFSDRSRQTVELTQARSDIKKLKEQSATFDARLAKRTEVADLLAEVLRSADRGNLKILYTKPVEPAPVSQGILKFPYEIELLGAYHAVASFFSCVESHAKFMRIARADLTAAQDDNVRAKVLICFYGAAEPHNDADEPPNPHAALAPKAP